MGKIVEKTLSAAQGGISPMMGRIERMVAEMCPEGVKICTLEEVSVDIYSGATPSKTIKAYWDGGTIPWMSSGEVNQGIVTHVEGRITQLGYDKCSTKMVPLNSVVIALAGQGKTRGTVALMKTEACTNQSLAAIVPTNRLSGTYLYHYLKTQYRKLRDISSGDGTRGGLNLKMLKGYPIPLPPLPIQEAIADILDKFDRLSAELQAELQARKQQYEYYRNQLLTHFAPDQPVTEYSLGDLGTFTRGTGLQKSDFTEVGSPCIHYGQVHTYYKTFAYKTKSFTSNALFAKLKKAKKGDLIIATTSEDVEACCKATAWLGDYDVAISGDSYMYSHNQNPKYMSYLFQTEAFAKQKRKVASGAKVIRVSGESMAKFRFLFPSLEEQARIVSILDKFEALVNDLSQGLPAEIAAVKEQYEYYRNKLLTFDKKS